MPKLMSTEERELRHRLDEAVRRIRSTLGQCPFVDDLDGVDIEAAAVLADQANRSLLDAMSCTDTLAQLRGASEEAIVLIATSRTALGVVREVLTVLTAAIDFRQVA